MKPHLKLSVTGQLFLLADGTSGLTQQQTRKFIKLHYGSLIAFSQAFDLPYQPVCDATRADDTSDCGGRIADVRRLLGLPISPAGRALQHRESLRKKRTGFRPASFLKVVLSQMGANQ